MFITIAYGYVGVVQLLLFLAYTAACYKAAKAKSERNKKMMMTLFSNWEKIMETARSYERAHFFDNVEHEIGCAHEMFVSKTIVKKEMKGGSKRRMMSGGSLDVYAIGVSNLRTAVVEYQTFNDYITKLSDVVDKEGAVDLGERGGGRRSEVTTTRRGGTTARGGGGQRGAK